MRHGSIQANFIALSMSQILNFCMLTVHQMLP